MKKISNTSVKERDTENDWFVEAIRRALPTEVFPLCKLTELTSGLVNSKSVSNKLSLGIGPPVFKAGSKIGLTRDTFIAWLIEKGQIKSHKRV